jgi:hypothetical protein
MANWRRQIIITADYLFVSRFIHLWFYIIFLVLICPAKPCLSADQPIERPSPISNTTSLIQPSATNTLQFMGLVDVGERQVIALLPGEVVDTYHCKQGDVVKKGDLVVKLNNDSIANGIADLILKKNRVKEGAQQLQFAELEKRQKEKQLQKVEGLINTEKSLKNQVAGYTSPVLQQLETQRVTLQEQLEISSARITSLKENNSDNEEILKGIKTQLDDLEIRRQNLTIKAPFDARVFFLNPNPSRIPPGGMVCELRNEAFSIVRGRIIQHQRNLIKVGDVVKIALDYSTNESVEGKIQSIEYIQEHREMQGYSSFEVIIRIDAQAKWLQTGMMVTISRQAPSREKQ